MTGSEHLNMGAYVLDALPSDEMAAFEEHLSDCQSCTDEYAGFLETASLLAAAVAAPPPAELRARVLAKARQTPQRPPRTLPREGADQVPDRSGGAGRYRHGVSWWRRPITLIAAAAAVVALVAGGIVATMRSGTSPEQAAKECVVAAPDAQVESPSIGRGGSVTIARSCDAAILTPADLPHLPADKGYQLWIMVGDQARSAGMLADQTLFDGKIVVTDLHKSDTDVGISVEPAGGSTAPTTTPVWVVPLKS